MSKLIANFATTISMGKINYLNNGKRSCPVKVEMELSLRANKEGYEYWEFTARGKVFNHIGTDIYMGGQCLDEIYDFRKADKDFKKVYGWWKNYHLNDLNAGTREQEQAIKEWKQTHTYDYSAVCEYLKEMGIYEVPFHGYTVSKKYNGESYRYGSEWVIELIPEDVVEEMKAFIGSHNGTVKLYDEEYKYGKDITDKVFKKGA